MTKYTPQNLGKSGPKGKIEGLVWVSDPQPEHRRTPGRHPGIVGCCIALGFSLSTEGFGSNEPEIIVHILALSDSVLKIVQNSKELIFTKIQYVWGPTSKIQKPLRADTVEFFCQNLRVQASWHKMHAPKFNQRQFQAATIGRIKRVRATKFDWSPWKSKIVSTIPRKR